MMIFTQVTKIETSFHAVIQKLVFSVLFCLLSIQVSGHSLIWESADESVIFVTKSTTIVNIQASEDYTISNQNTESIASEPIVFVTKGTTIVNLQVSENYDIINLNEKREANDAASKQSSLKRTQQPTSVAPQKGIKQKQSLPENRNIVFENIPSKDTYERSLKFNTNVIVPTSHQQYGKTIVLNSIFYSFICTYSDDKISETVISLKKSYFFNSFFARPPPM
ncbi:hypothetical protein SAMN05421796_10213 [Chryseobacterium piscicola]|uniref:Uncharacterized protein n=1 Tax=Chryseobacterium piscicola TaxID=551459 RepID=A0A1N7L4A2_9FLAO|nr:hypothetical protein [Chryseobacterium piscicola]PQA97352.1 hypothetical protein B0A70_01405 [Chryseobacterium piscicola]SIS68633.1 hypothetical protein SAMN05421796_10213 [Chryseobacterium piscicola]